MNRVCGRNAVGYLTNLEYSPLFRNVIPGTDFKSRTKKKGIRRPYSLCTLVASLLTQLPAFAVFALHKLVSRIEVGGTHIRSIPHQLDVASGIVELDRAVFPRLADVIGSNSEVTHENRFGQRACDFERRAYFHFSVPRETRFNPLGVVAIGSSGYARVFLRYVYFFRLRGR